VLHELLDDGLEFRLELLLLLCVFRILTVLLLLLWLLGALTIARHFSL
jgi:hypothetical protein